MGVSSENIRAKHEMSSPKAKPKGCRLPQNKPSTPNQNGKTGAVNKDNGFILKYQEKKITIAFLEK